MDREALQEYFDQLESRYYGYEIIEILETAGLISVQDILDNLEEFIIEGRTYLEAR